MMKENLILIFTIITLTSCIKNQNTDESILTSTHSLGNIGITAKLVVVDGSVEHNLNYCADEIKHFSKMDVYDCSFLIDEVEYNLRKKYTFNDKGQFDSYWMFKSEGPVVYSNQDLVNDEKFFAHIGGKDLSVKIKGSYVIENIDTFQIEKILKKQKLIFVTAINEDKTRNIYQYE